MKKIKMICANCGGDGCHICNGRGWIIDEVEDGDYAPGVSDAGSGDDGCSKIIGWIIVMPVCLVFSCIGSQIYNLTDSLGISIVVGVIGTVVVFIIFGYVLGQLLDKS
jgi:hypothetical protein